MPLPQFFCVMFSKVTKASKRPFASVNLRLNSMVAKPCNCFLHLNDCPPLPYKKKSFLILWKLCLPSRKIYVKKTLFPPLRDLLTCIDRSSLVIQLWRGLKRRKRKYFLIWGCLISQSCTTTVYPEAVQVLCFIYLKLVTLIGGWKL